MSETVTQLEDFKKTLKNKDEIAKIDEIIANIKKNEAQDEK
jgi:hypothetical protein